MKLLGDLAKLVNGQVSACPELPISGAASISRAIKTEITFLTSDKYIAQFLDSNAGAAVVTNELQANLDHSNKPLITVENVEEAFSSIVEFFRPQIARETIGISPHATVSSTAQIGEGVSIHPGAVVMENVSIGNGTVIFPNVTVMENCSIGDEVQIFPHTTLYENTVVGNRVILHAGVVLGAYGFGYDSSSAVHILSAQLGNVVIEDDVEVGANTTIDRGTYGSTTIGRGTKLDNLVMVGHNCEIGEHNLFCSQVGIAGSCTTKEYVVMGGQVGLADHLNISAKAMIAAKSGLMHDVPEGARMFGIPARAAREEMQIVAVRAKLPDLKKTVSKLSKRVAVLEAEQNLEEPGENQAA